MKKILFIIGIIFYSTIFANPKELNVIVNVNRFLDENQNTIFNIDYEIPYKSVKFIKSDYGFGGEVEVVLNLIKNDKSHTKQFSNNIILSDQIKTVSDETFKDRISLTLKKSGLKVEISFIDILNGNMKMWDYEFIVLEKSVIISDLEFSSIVTIDTTLYLQKFHRENKLYHINNSHIYTQGLQTELHIYYELYNFNENSESTFIESIIISKNGSSEKEISVDIAIQKNVTPIHRKVDISDLSQGLYEIILKIDNRNDIQTKTEVFSIKKNIAAIGTRFFIDMEKELKFVKYFLNSTEKKKLLSLRKEIRSEYIGRYWKSKDPNPITAENELATLIRSRIQYANEKFSYQKKEGWETDRGRLYLRYGEPDEIMKLNTNMYQTDILNESETKVFTAYGSKDFQIWKYRTSHYETYILLDQYNNRNFKLIYSGNDDTEKTQSNWKHYLGGDNFDMDLLN
ncbi:MAG: GWxTD domain-containing protein [Candidatus Cloacimonetes bacterium]|nr:GWxTD domain-containing protein [Candidatus Cloacimonadota bacterium]